MKSALLGALAVAALSVAGPRGMPSAVAQELNPPSGLPNSANAKLLRFKAKNRANNSDRTSNAGGSGGGSGGSGGCGQTDIGNIKTARGQRAPRDIIINIEGPVINASNCR